MKRINWGKFKDIKSTQWFRDKDFNIKNILNLIKTFSSEFLFNSKSINGKLVRLVIIIELITILLFVNIFGFFFATEMRSSIRSEISIITKTYSEYMSVLVSSLKESLETVARLQGLDPEGKSDYEFAGQLRALAVNLPFRKLQVAGITGKTNEGNSVFNAEYFKQARLGNTYLESPQLEDGTYAYTLSTQIKNGNASGVLIAKLSSLYINDIIKSYKDTTQHNGFCFILDKKGNIIAHSDEDSMMPYFTADGANEEKEYAELVESMLGAEEQVISQGTLYDSKKYHISYTPIAGEEGWVFVTVIPTSVVANAIVKQMILVSCIALVLFILVMGITIKVAKVISEPIKMLTNRIIQLSEGDLSAEVPVVDAKDETGELSDSLCKTVNNLNNYVTEIDSVLLAIANKDLRSEITGDYVGDFEDIKKALLRIMNDLNKIMKGIQVSSDQVSVSAGELSASSDSIARGVTQQSDAMERVLSVVTDVTDMANNNVKMAEKTESVVSEVSVHVADSVMAMDAMGTAMQSIATSSEEIKKIVGVVDDIAFQTNILALNASIEAAKAGKYGRGFSVVAEEVRHLAENCTEVLKDIESLIAESVKGVQTGVELTKGVTNKLDSVAKAMEKTTMEVGQIHEYSISQASSIEALQNGLSEIDKVVQANAAASEQSASMAEELKEQASKLTHLVNQFKLK